VKEKFVKAYMEVAEVFANLSHAKRLKVGAIVVKGDRIISIGYNGTPAGWDNVCEDENYRTIPEVVHAEANSIAKLAKSQESGEEAIMFITHTPCVECSKLIYTSGIKKVYFKNYYRDQSGLEFLKKCKVEVEQVNA
jgi:dCMP deaminase